MPDQTASARRPPRHRGGRPVLTRDAVGRAALDLMARTGSHRDVTMRAVATELDVTAKALYRLVDDKRDLLLAAAHLAESEWPVADPDAASWEDELRRHLRAIRAWYRRYPELLDVVRDFDMTADVHHNALLGLEMPYRLLLRAGVPAAEVASAWGACMLSVFGFAQFQDAMVDRPPQGASAEAEVVAERVLDTHATLDTPGIDAVLAATPALDNDGFFDDVLDIVLRGVRARVVGAEPEDGPPSP